MPEDQRTPPADDLSVPDDEPAPATNDPSSRHDPSAIDDDGSPAGDDLGVLAARAADLGRDECLALLGAGEVEIVGRMPWSSNGTFLVFCRAGGQCVPAVYKPEDGERPLWDFPPGIHRREVAAYELSERLGIGIVPETVTRHDAPFGVGSVQRFVPADFAQHYFTLLDEDTTHDRLRVLATFDVLANNADRKGGHVLAEAQGPGGREQAAGHRGAGSRGRDSTAGPTTTDAGRHGDQLAERQGRPGIGAIWGIDNGLCFHVEAKLRTVIWEFAGDPVPETLRGPLAEVAGDPGLDDLLDPDERAALSRRARRLLARGRLPHPDQRRHHIPWPPV